MGVACALVRAHGGARGGACYGVAACEVPHKGCCGKYVSFDAFFDESKLAPCARTVTGAKRTKSATSRNWRWLPHGHIREARHFARAGGRNRKLNLRIHGGPVALDGTYATGPEGLSLVVEPNTDSIGCPCFSLAAGNPCTAA